jgi:hypothetical protein
MPRSRSTSRNSPNSIITISSPITTPEEFYNISTPPSGIHPNITIRRPRTPSAPQRRRSLTMDDEDIYNTLLDLENDRNSSYSLLDSPEWFVETDDNYVSPVRPRHNNVSPSEQRGINASLPFSYERKQKYDITGLSNKKLDNHKGKIKIKKTQTIYDVIMMEDTNIHDYIKEDVDNIVFLYENNYYLLTKSRLSEIINMTTTENAIMFDCGGIGYSNVRHDYPYVLMNKLGIMLNEFINVISLENAISITKPTSGQYFIIKGTNEVLISTTSDNVLYGRYPNRISANHCQGGKHAIVFDIQKFKPNYVNDSKSPKSSKTKKKTKCMNKKSCKKRLK